MRKIRLVLGIILPDLGGIIIASFPMAVFLSLTNLITGSSSDLSPVMIAFILLISLSLFLFPTRLLIIFVHLLKIELDKYSVFSVAIIGGLIGGSFFYLLVLSHFTLNWTNFLDYVLLGVFQNIIVQSIYCFIPKEWKIQPAE